MIHNNNRHTGMQVVIVHVTIHITCQVCFTSCVAVSVKTNKSFNAYLHVECVESRSAEIMINFLVHV